MINNSAKHNRIINQVINLIFCQLIFKNLLQINIQVTQVTFGSMRLGQGKNLQQAKKRNIEIINNLKQTLSKPTIVEAQRTLKILQRLIDRIGVFLNLDSDFIVKFNQVNNPQKLKLNRALVQQLSPQVLDLSIKQAKLQIQFRGYASLEQQLKDGEAIQEEKILEFNRIKKDMEYNFKSLVRALEKNSNDLQIFKSLKSNSTPNSQAFNVLEALSNYKVIMQKTLATAAQQEESHTRLIEELNSKIISLEKTRANCQSDLLKLKQQRAKHAQDKKEEIDKLRSQINQIKKNQESQMDKIAKQSKQMTQALMKDHKLKQDKLKGEIQSQKKKLQKLREQNKRQEDKSKSDKFNNEAQLIDMIATYDKDMLALTTTKSQASKKYKTLTDELNNLKRHFSEIEQERKREEAILQADRKRREEWELNQKKKGQAATRIKQAYRLWKTKNKKKKKKK